MTEQDDKHPAQPVVVLVNRRMVLQVYRYIRPFLRHSQTQSICVNR